MPFQTEKICMSAAVTAQILVEEVSLILFHEAVKRVMAIVRRDVAKRRISLKKV